MNSAKLPQGAMNDAINAVYPLIPTDGSSVGQRLEIAKAIVEAVLQATQQPEGSDTIHALKCEVAALKKRNGELYRELNALRDVGIVLSAEGSKRLIELLENPPAPNEALKELFRKHGASVVSRGVSRRIPCGCVTGGEPCSHFSNSGTQQSKDDKPLADTLADIACGTPVPKGFGEYVDGTDGERIGTNIALWVNWRDFFTAMLQRTPLSPWWSPALRTEQAEGQKPKITEDQAMRLIEEYNSGYAVVDALLRAGFEWPDA